MRLKPLAVALSFGLALLPGSFGSAAEPATGDREWQRKVARTLLATPQDSAVDFLVVLVDQAAIDPAPARAGRDARIARVVTRLRETAAASQTPLLAELDALGAEARPFWVTNAIHVRGSRSALEAMARREDVARIDANPVSAPPRPTRIALPSAAPLAVDWNIGIVGADQVWAQGYDGSGVVVGSQDTGFFWDHPALRSAYRGWNGTTAAHAYNWHDAIHSDDFASPTCPANSPAPCDDGFLFPHGTYTMGISVGDDGLGNQIGVAPGARWMGCRNSDLLGGTVASYLECFQWLLAPTDLAGQNPNPALAPHVLNNSWACIPAEGCNPDTLETVINNVRAAGVVVVAAAGNDGAGCSTIEYPPAIYESSMTVGATNAADLIGPISSRGPVTIDGSNRLKPNLTAPGINVRSAVGIWDIFKTGEVLYDYMAADGTSASAPHVAGAVALLLDARPDLAGQVEVIESLLEQSALPRTATQTCGGIPGSQVPNNVFGYGRLDVAELVLGDADADGTSTLADCAPADPSAWQPPGPPTDLRLAGGAATEFSWSAPAQPGASVLVYDLVRAGGPVDFGMATCIATNVSITNSSDSDIPAPDSLFYYLVRAESACGGDDETSAAATCE